MKTKLLIKISITFLILSSCVLFEKKENFVKLSGPQVTASARELVRITNDVIPELQPRLSPDGKKLLYTTRDDAKTGVDRWSIRLKNDVMGQGFTPLTGNKTSEAYWINNEDFIFQYFTGSKPIIATSNINRLGITYLGQNNYGDWDSHPSLSPDGKRVLLSTSLNGSENICLVDRDGSKFTVISEGENPIWHPNGNVILFNKKTGDYYQLFELDLTTYQTKQLTSGEFSSHSPHYSPDGGHIAFISTQDNKYNHLFIMKRDGRNLTQLSGGRSLESHPFWGVDGYIYFSSSAGARKKETDRGDYALRWNYMDIWRVKPIIVNN